MLRSGSPIKSRTERSEASSLAWFSTACTGACLVQKFKVHIFLPGVRFTLPLLKEANMMALGFSS